MHRGMYTQPFRIHYIYVKYYIVKTERLTVIPVRHTTHGAYECACVYRDDSMYYNDISMDVTNWVRLQLHEFPRS